jgi:hypothetical protein
MRPSMFTSYLLPITCFLSLAWWLSRRFVWAAFGAVHGDKCHAKITHAFQHSVERRLVGEIAGKDRFAAWLVLDFQPVEPICPVAGEMTFHSNLAVKRLSHGYVPFLHSQFTLKAGGVSSTERGIREVDRGWRKDTLVASLVRNHSNSQKPIESVWEVWYSSICERAWSK